MAQNGYITARIYTSRGELPIEGAVVTIVSNETNPPTLVGKRTTDKNGLTAPVTVSAPDQSKSESPSDTVPFSVVDVRVDHPRYYTVFIKDSQIFANRTTIIDTELIPIVENESYDNMTEEFTVTPQNL